MIMKKCISVICCLVFISIASLSFAEEEQLSPAAKKTQVVVQIIQFESQLQMLNNIITNLTTSTQNLKDKIASLKESLKQLEQTKTIEDEVK